MPQNQLTIETPIGTLSFSLQVTEGDLRTAQINSCKTEPDLSKGMSVEGCFTILLRCLSPTPIKGLKFFCTWGNLSVAGYGNSGEALDAWEWEHNNTIVMVGTEDDEWLRSRINLKESGPDEYSVSMINNCIKIQIDEFPPNQELSLHYVVAWNSLPEKTDSSCWFAIDIPHEKILEINKR